MTRLEYYVANMKPGCVLTPKKSQAGIVKVTAIAQFGDYWELEYEQEAGKKKGRKRSMVQIESIATGYVIEGIPPWEPKPKLSLESRVAALEDIVRKLQTPTLKGI